MTTSAGTKFGKTEQGTIWLDPQLTSPFRFYQFWLNTDDRDVVKYLMFFTWLDRATIEALERVTVDAPERREAQRTLAREVTTLVHGASAVDSAERASAVLFGSSLADATRRRDPDGVRRRAVRGCRGVGAHGRSESRSMLAVRAGLAASNGEATRLIKQGGLYMNDQRVTDERGRVTLDHAIDRTGHRAAEGAARAPARSRVVSGVVTRLTIAVMRP